MESTPRRSNAKQMELSYGWINLDVRREEMGRYTIDISEVKCGLTMFGLVYR